MAEHKGGRARTGTVIRLKTGQLQGIITLADGSRKRLPPFPKGTSEAMAKEKTAHFAELAAERGIRRATPEAEPEPQDVAEWIDRWHKDRVRRKLTSARVSLGHWTEHLRPYLSKDPRTWTKADFRAVSKALDDKVTAGEISWKTAQNVWGTATKLGRDAAEAKDDQIRCRDDNPALGVRGPDRGEKTAKQYLFPSEFLKLTASESVPLDWRRIFAVAVYTYARLGELLALTWEDVDIEHGSLSITRAIDSHTGTEKTTKSKAPRRIPIEPNLLPLLVAMHREAGGKGQVLRFPTKLHHANALRDGLDGAGLKRRSLYHRGPSVKPIGFHDLRATGVTWMAVRGDEPLRIQQRAGHTTFSTTQIYIREADAVREGFGEPFPKLPATLLGQQSIGAIDRGRRQKRIQQKRCSALVGAAGFEPGAGSTTGQDSGLERHHGESQPCLSVAPKCPKLRSGDPGDRSLDGARTEAAGAGLSAYLETLADGIARRLPGVD